MKYFVKMHCEATELCTIATGRIQDYYFGHPITPISRDVEPTQDSCGYDTEAEAIERMNTLSKRKVDGDGMWDIEYSVVSYGE